MSCLKLLRSLSLCAFEKQNEHSERDSSNIPGAYSVTLRLDWKSSGLRAVARTEDFLGFHRATHTTGASCCLWAVPSQPTTGEFVCHFPRYFFVRLDDNLHLTAAFFTHGGGLWHTVPFLPQALRLGTRTVFCFQGTTSLFFLNEGKAEIQGLKPQSPNPWVLRPVACGGLKPHTVKKSTMEPFS